MISGSREENVARLSFQSLGGMPMQTPVVTVAQQLVVIVDLDSPCAKSCKLKKFNYSNYGSITDM
jgi:hypothetical protein